MKLVVTIAMIVLLAACPPAPSPPEPDTLDASAASCGSVCANLTALKCAEGFRSDCVATCEHSKILTNLHTACLATAKTKTDARACGSVSCP